MRLVSRLSLVTLSVSLLMLPVSAGLAAGKTLYVKMSGKDSASCTAADPCRNISLAVSVAASGDTITVGSGQFLEYNGIAIDKDLTITGGGRFFAGVGWAVGTMIDLLIDASKQFTPVFDIRPGAKLKLQSLTVSGGSQSGITNEGGSLTLTDVLIWNNSDGGVHNGVNGSLIMTRVGISNNSGLAGLINEGTATVIDSFIEGTSHQANKSGHGVFNSGTLFVSRGEIAENEGGGLYQFNYGIECTAVAYLLNVTISTNHNRGIEATCGQLILQHITVAENTAADTGAGGLRVINDAVLQLWNSIVAKNSGKQCDVPPQSVVDHSLIGDKSCPGDFLPGTGNLVGVDPKLSDTLAVPAFPLGTSVLAVILLGAHRVHALLPGSPAIDSGSDKYCKQLFYGGWATDQLGVPRPIDGDGDGKPHCDMGAYEYQPPG